MSQIEEAIEALINAQLSRMDFSDMVINEVRDMWDMDQLDRVDDIADTVESLENNLDSSTLENMDQKIDLLTDFVDKKITKIELAMQNFEQSEQYLQHAWKTLSDKLEDALEELQNEIRQKSFFQKLMFWR